MAGGEEKDIWARPLSNMLFLSPRARLVETQMRRGSLSLRTRQDVLCPLSGNGLRGWWLDSGWEKEAEKAKE